MVKPGSIDKQLLLGAIKAHLQRELEVLEASAAAAHEAATHEDARAENEYDTRGLEASYLAKAQLARAAEVKGILSAIEFLEPKQFGEDDPIGLTAVVELEPEDGPRQLCFVVAVAAGLKIELGKKTITVITPQSPLGQALLGRRVGDGIEVVQRGAERAYEITRVE